MTTPFSPPAPDPAPAHQASPGRREAGRLGDGEPGRPANSAQRRPRQLDVIAPTRLLVVDHRPEAARLVAEAFERERMRPEIELAETVSALRKILATSTSEGRTFDAVVAGHDPPGTDALDIIDAVAEEGGERPGPTPPVIVFSPRLDEEVLVDLLREGAVDVLSWERPRRLPAAVSRALREAGHRTGRGTAETALRGTEARLRSVLNTAIDGILVADTRGRLVFANPAAAKMFGFGSADSLVGEPLTTLMTAGDAAMHDVFLSGHHPGAPTRALGQQGRPLLGRRQDGSTFPVEASVGSFTDGEGHRFFTGVLRDASERATAEARRNILVGELNHRVKNTLASVLAIATQTLRAADKPMTDRERDFTGRMMALAAAHDLLTAHSWEGATLPAVVHAALAPWMGGHTQGERPAGSAQPSSFGTGTSRILLSGPEGVIPLRPVQAQTLVLALHELATNAAKYGALSGEAGEVRVTWSGDGAGHPALFEWTETGGPTLVTRPTRRGFGTRLIERLLAHDLGTDASVRLDFRPEGVRAEVRFAAASLAQVDSTSLDAAVREASKDGG